MNRNQKIFNGSLAEVGLPITTNIEGIKDGKISKPLAAKATELINPTPVVANELIPKNYARLRNNNEIITPQPLHYQQLTRNKLISAEILGSSLESTKILNHTQRGYRRVTTHIIRKVSTLSRAEEQRSGHENILRFTKNSHARPQSKGHFVFAPDFQSTFCPTKKVFLRLENFFDLIKKLHLEIKAFKVCLKFAEFLIPMSCLVDFSIELDIRYCSWKGGQCFSTGGTSFLGTSLHF